MQNLHILFMRGDKEVACVLLTGKKIRQFAKEIKVFDENDRLALKVELLDGVTIREVGK